MATPYEVYQPETHPRPEPQLRADRSAGQSFHRSIACCGHTDARRRWAMVSAVCVAIWLVTGAGYFWPMWVMLGLGIPVLFGRR